MAQHLKKHTIVFIRVEKFEDEGIGISFIFLTNFAQQKMEAHLSGQKTPT